MPETREGHKCWKTERKQEYAGFVGPKKGFGSYSKQRDLATGMT